MVDWEQNVTAAGIGEILYSTGTTTYDSLAAGNSGQCLTSGGAGAPSWQSCALGAGTNFWNSSFGALYPGNSTLDLLVGSTATSSAKFSVLNIAGTLTPVASLSAIGGSDDTKGIYLKGDGSIQSVRMNTLTIGGATTGNITIDSGSNVTTLSDATVNLAGGTASRFLLTDANKSVTYSGLSSVLSDTLSDETGGGGVAVFNTSPAITTSLTTGSTSFDLIDTTATTVNFARATTTSLTIGATSGTLNLQHPTINVGGGGAVNLATVSNDNLTITPNGTGDLILTGDFDTQVLVGASGATTKFPLLVRSGIGSNASFAVDNLNSGD